MCADQSPGGHGPVRSMNASVNPRERAVVWEHPGTGEIRYPGRNDTPMPSYYSREGFVRKELRHLSDIRALERRERVASEIGNFDSNGRSLDGT